MTDNEIIKALRFCSDPDTCSDDCSFYVEGETVHECTTKLSVAALDLIQRQQEELDRLERHTKMHDEIQAEAVKEFADRIVEMLEGMVQYNRDLILHYSGKRDVTVPIGYQTRGIEISIEVVKDVVKGVQNE